MQLILQMIKKHTLLFCSSLFFLAAESLCDLLQPALMSYIVDEGIKNKDMDIIIHIGGIMLAVAIIGAICAVIRNNLSSVTSQKIGCEMRSLVYNKILSFSPENTDKFRTGSLITRAGNDVTQVQNFINSSMRILIKSPIMCLGSIILLFTQTPTNPFIVIIIIIICIIFIAGNMIMSYPRFGKLQKNIDRLNDVSREFLNSIRVVKSFRRENYEERKFSANASALADSSVSAIRVSALFGPLINLTINASIVILLLLGIGSEVPQVGGIMASINYMTHILFSLGLISMILNLMSRALASSARISEVLNEKPSMEWKKESSENIQFFNLDFKNVSFCYPSLKKNVLENISFSVPENSVVGIIGSTGCGKTSLVNLICRFYDPSSGSIAIGGVNIKNIPEKTLRNITGIVSQKTYIFSGTIRDNLLMGSGNASEEDINNAVYISCADEFIKSLKNGYNTILGQAGVNLSGGQKQRLAIARTLLKKPPILILDDSTSALDAYTEKEVLKRIKKYSNNSVIFIVSQKISSVISADYILVMDKGKICGCGSHEALIKNCNIYREIYESQIGGIVYEK